MERGLCGLLVRNGGMWRRLLKLRVTNHVLLSFLCFFLYSFPFVFSYIPSLFFLWSLGEMLSLLVALLVLMVAYCGF